ncbi:nucleotide-diphospho-sugar transferase [Dactylonectria estremocensis]|uniref:Nucleotide-diphospho-sugar transferase n=1 Tax=Dactylonectria estremocensis TaxID=1079267 RepID=A0A9P9IX03_9HYPO|nr:nucleotide-diphospho-sugar transferase [Dactylonectria estremocensis]
MDEETPSDLEVVDIVIPEQLLWAPTTLSHKRDHQVDDAAKFGPVQQAVDAHLKQVHHGAGTRTLNFFVSRPEPTTSDDDWDDDLSNMQYTAIDETPSRNNTQSEKASPCRIRFADDTTPSPPPRTTKLFKALSSYSMNTQGSSLRQDLNERDPRARNSFYPPSSPAGVSAPTTPKRSRFGSFAPASMQKPAWRRSHASGRKSSIYEVYDRAKIRGAHLRRKRWAQIVFEYAVYILLLCFIYFVLVGLPLWKGAVWYLYREVHNTFAVTVGFSIVFGIAALYAFAPLLVLFENDPAPIETFTCNATKISSVRNTALIIPCYKSAHLIGNTLDAAMKIFPPENIFVIANGNSPTPLDSTEQICALYGVAHLWCPIGSKIVAQFVGCYAAKAFKDVLLIDDDCTLPANFPIVGDRLVGKVKAIGYTIKSVGPSGSKGNYCRQAQDLEYKMSGLQRAFAGAIGSATFPHGAVSLWDREFLISVFHDHPGFSVSEDWFFGHSCRRLGGRIKMCSAVFVETETPPAVFNNTSGDRGRFGEVTVFKQRFLRWDFFFVNGIFYNIGYILGSWRLGWWELGTKLCVFQEIYETLLFLFIPFILPIALMLQPLLCGYLFAGMLGLYYLNSIIFNEVHLRLKNERVGFMILISYYIPYKIILTVIHVLSCYWAIFKYARYFANRHPKVVEDENAVEIVLRLEDTTNSPTTPDQKPKSNGRRMTVTRIMTRMSVSGNEPKMPVALIGETQARDKRTARKNKGLSVQVTDIPTSPGMPQRRVSRTYGADVLTKVD